MVPTKKVWTPVEVVMQHLRPHMQTIADSIHEGFSEYFKLPAEQRMKLHARSQASDVRDFIVDAVRRRFESTDGATFVEQRGMFLLVIDGIASVRFKKLDRKKRSRNVETQQSLNFALGTMPGFLETTACIDAGYVLDATQTKIVSAHVVFPGEKGKVPLSFDLPAATTKKPAPMRLASSRTSTVAPKETARVVPIRKVNDDENG